MTGLVLAIAAIVIAILERLQRWRFRPAPLLRAYFGSDVIYLLTGFVAGNSLALAYVVAASRWVDASFGIPRLASVDLPLWITVPLALVALDLGNYIAHVMLHRVDALWELHKVHHSSRTLDWLATFRSHLFEQVFRRLLAPVIIIVLGLPIGAVAIASTILLGFAMLNHANLRIDLRFMEPLFVTPRLHRLHHVPDTSDRNFGTVFAIWDRLRNTLAVNDTDPDAAFGVPGQVETYPQGWTAQLVEPFGGWGATAVAALRE